MLLKQSTAQTVVIGPILDADGVAVTTAVVTNISIAKNGSAAALTTETLTHLTNGYYTLALTTGNTNTTGRLEIFVNAATMSMANHRYNILIHDSYEAIVSGARMLCQVAGIDDDAITGPSLASDAVTKIQSGLATSAGLTTVEGKVDTLLARITSTLFSGITYLSRWLGAIAGKTADTTTRTEINATTAGAAYNETTDSQEAIRDRGDAAWITGGTTNVAPLQATAPNRVAGTEIVTYITDTSPIGPIAITDGDGTAVNLSSYTLKVCIERISDGTILANITPTVSGTSSNQITFTPTADCVSSTKPARWSLRSTTANEVLGYGLFTVESVARLS